MRTIDLFAGCGGLSLGFQNAGFDMKAAFEIWKPAIKVYQRNFSHPIFQVDLSKESVINTLGEWKPEVIIGGPPCQDFSSAGKRDESLGRANLTINFAGIIASIKPQFFVMENVSRITKTQTLKVTWQILKNSGYGLTASVLDASYCGVPQARKRYFLIGELEGKDNALEPYLFKNYASKPMTVFDYLGLSLGIEYFYRHPRSYQRRGIFSIYEPSPTVRGVNRPIPKTYQKHQGDACDLNPSLRPLTTMERSYIQTFPKSFKFEGSKSDLEQMIGNAVPVKLAEYVAGSLLKYIEDGYNHVGSHDSYIQLSLFN
ncbi:DNA cytosine methyltransferase [Arthrospira platensis]|uniref:Cytosine-specific methyltransferase n=2 Tax=Limnospira platensis TaxID=118562 RepID=Q307A8_LIMPL|nr:DNA cytosine methyltransferase [Arthrospira platensis]AMW26859.1 modification methylase [Arthrospira platensis YZ]KDR57349.1 modification methylase [Arthrospira platensis str. Paraca]MBD2669345.1 DNA cytosine methyltransferase [Arthrospira platensis FACHB-439]MBD2709757.1 DNA cytosine methyltransferase [Arthrospira platensis FACHB-835]MDF2211758.1 DNA cytosine methyltransferase [Arthrospira platensis NCB002]MDT9182289.1 DNA cytosine methyltransferase [Limnospira sp. PMC 289.06]MDT9294422.